MEPTPKRRRSETGVEEWSSVKSISKLPFQDVVELSVINQTIVGVAVETLNNAAGRRKIIQWPFDESVEIIYNFRLTGQDVELVVGDEIRCNSQGVFFKSTEPLVDEPGIYLLTPESISHSEPISPVAKKLKVAQTPSQRKAAASISPQHAHSSESTLPFRIPAHVEVVTLEDMPDLWVFKLGYGGFNTFNLDRFLHKFKGTMYLSRALYYEVSKIGIIKLIFHYEGFDKKNDKGS